MKYCKNCGSQMSDDAKFCVQCGAAASEPAKPEPAAAKAVGKTAITEVKNEYTAPVQTFQSNMMRQESVQPRTEVPFLANPVFLGVWFIVSGLLMLLLTELPVTNLLDNAADTAITLRANHIILGFENFCFQAPAMIAIVTGVVLLQRKKGSFNVALVGGIFQLLAAIGALIIVLLSTVLTPILVQGQISDPETIEVSIKLIRNRGLSRCLIVEFPILLIGISSFVFTLIARSKERRMQSQRADDLFGKMPRSAVSLIVLLPFVPLFFMIKDVWESVLLVYHYEFDVLVAAPYVNGVIASFSIPVIYLILITIIYCMLGYRWKKGTMIIPGMSTVLLYGIITTMLVMVFGKEMLKDFHISAEVLAEIQRISIFRILEHALMALALFFWIAASARGCIPAWLQGILASAVIILYIVFELLFTVGMRLDGSILISQYVIDLIILGFSIPMSLACKPKKG